MQIMLTAENTDVGTSLGSGIFPWPTPAQTDTLLSNLTSPEDSNSITLILNFEVTKIFLIKIS